MKTYTDTVTPASFNEFLSLKYSFRPSIFNFKKARVLVRQFKNGTSGLIEPVVDLTTYVLEHNSVAPSGAFRECASPKIVRTPTVFVRIGDDVYIAAKPDDFTPIGCDYQVSLASSDKIPQAYSNQHIKDEIEKIEKQLEDLRKKL